MSAALRPESVRLALQCQREPRSLVATPLYAIAERLGEHCLQPHREITRSFATVSTLQELGNVVAPTLLIYGTDSPQDSVAAAAVARSLPSSMLARISGAGHDPWFDSPRQFFLTIRSFLDTRVATDR